jgi:hypothetical protein
MSPNSSPPALHQCLYDYTSRYTSSIRGRVIEVEVGSGIKSEIFHIHSDVLSSSPFLHNASKPAWTEGREKKPIDLSDEDSLTFDIYAQWLYSHNLLRFMGALRLAKLYVLGEKLMHDEFQNSVIDGLINNADGYREIPQGETVNIIYQGTPEGSPARRLMVDLCCYLMREKESRVEWADHHPEFINDMLTAVFHVRELPPLKERPWARDLDSYHRVLEQGSFEASILSPESPEMYARSEGSSGLAASDDG